MKRFTLVAVYSPDKRHILFCHRSKEPYKGLFNLPGGKVERDEFPYIISAHRELEEETGITKDDIRLTHVMDLYYYRSKIWLSAYYGVLAHDVKLKPTENDLIWFDAEYNFFDPEFAGEGNLGHIIEQIKLIEEDKKRENSSTI